MITRVITPPKRTSSQRNDTKEVHEVHEVLSLPPKASTLSFHERLDTAARDSMGAWGGGMPTVDSSRRVTSILEEDAVEVPARVVRL